MIPKSDPLLLQVAEALRERPAPQVDVTRRVMEALPESKMSRFPAILRVVKRSSIAAAACLALLIVVDLTRLYAHDFDDEALGTMVSKVYDKDTYFSADDDISTALLEYASID